MSERSGIEIDYCPACRGVWLDRGELDKIIAANATKESPIELADNRTNSSYQSGHQKQHRKRESFLGDLFDF